MAPFSTPAGALADATLSRNLRRRMQQGVTVIWALLPLTTMGLAAAPCMALGALVRRSGTLGVCSLLYAAATAAAFPLVGSPSSAMTGVGLLLLLVVGLVATSHCWAIREAATTRATRDAQWSDRLLG